MDFFNLYCSSAIASLVKFTIIKITIGIVIVRVFKTKLFSKWAKKNFIRDPVLIDVAKQIRLGKVEADLGGGVLKKRLAKQGLGKRSSYRTIIAFRRLHHCFFMYGFQKNERANLSSKQLIALKILAKNLLSYSSKELEQYKEKRVLLEVNYGQR